MKAIQRERHEVDVPLYFVDGEEMPRDVEHRATPRESRVVRDEQTVRDRTRRIGPHACISTNGGSNCGRSARHRTDRRDAAR
jgi:hypothetical protein